MLPVREVLQVKVKDKSVLLKTVSSGLFEIRGKIFKM